MIAFLKDSFFSLLWKVLSLSINIAIAALISRGLGPDGRGTYDLALVFIMFFVLFVNLGMESALVYFIGKEKYSVERLISTSIFYCIGIYAILFGALSLFFHSNLDFVFQDFTPKIFYLCLFSALPQVISVLIRHVFLATKSIKKYNQCIVIEFMVFLPLLITLGYFGKTVDMVLIFYLIANLLSFIFHFFLFHKIGYRINPKAISRGALKDLLSQGSRFFLAGFASFWQSRIGLLYLGSFHSTASVGLFTTANKLPQLLMKIPNEVSLILYPYVAGMKEEDESEKFIAIVLKLLVLYPSLIFSVLFIVVISPVSDLIFGAEYSETIPATYLLILAAVFTGSTTVVSNYLAANGLVKFSVHATFINLLAIVIGGFWIIQAYDYYGLAFLSLLGALLGFAYIMVRIKIVTGLSWPALLIVNKKEILYMKGVIGHFLKKSNEKDK